MRKAFERIVNVCMAFAALAFIVASAVVASCHDAAKARTQVDITKEK